MTKKEELLEKYSFLQSILDKDDLSKAVEQYLALDSQEGDIDLGDYDSFSSVIAICEQNNRLIKAMHFQVLEVKNSPRGIRLLSFIEKFKDSLGEELLKEIKDNYTQTIFSLVNPGHPEYIGCKDGYDSSDESDASAVEFVENNLFNSREEFWSLYTPDILYLIDVTALCKAPTIEIFDFLVEQLVRHTHTEFAEFFSGELFKSILQDERGDNFFRQYIQESKFSPKHGTGINKILAEIDYFELYNSNKDAFLNLIRYLPAKPLQEIRFYEEGKGCAKSFIENLFEEHSAEIGLLKFSLEPTFSLLDLAFMKKDYDMVQMIIKAGVELEAKDLQSFLKYENSEMLEFLMAARPMLVFYNSNQFEGDACSMLGYLQQHPEIAGHNEKTELLLERGANPLISSFDSVFKSTPPCAECKAHFEGYDDVDLSGQDVDSATS